MAYGIMRVEKRKRAAVYGIQLEANRTVEQHEKGLDFASSDIDWSKTKENRHIKKTEKWNFAITKRLRAEKIKPRKDAICLLDGFYGASPEWFSSHSRADAEAYFEDCVKFHIKTYCGGDESLLLNAVIHWDEQTPHLQVASIPIKDGRLTAKNIMGNRADYRARQDAFFEEVSRSRDLERGDLNEAQDGREWRQHITKRQWMLKEAEESLKEAEQNKAEAEKVFALLLREFDRIAEEAEEAEAEAERLKQENAVADAQIRALKKEKAEAEAALNDMLAAVDAVQKKSVALLQGLNKIRSAKDMTNFRSAVSSLIRELNVVVRSGQDKGENKMGSGR